MIQFTNRHQLLKASDEEIEQFFVETTFEGIFSHEVRSKNTDFYKGHISNITLAGKPTKLISTFLNVPKSSKHIPEGPCSFKCKIKDIAAFREQPTKYIITMVGASLQTIDSITKPVVAMSAKDAQEQELIDMWGVDSCECIGFYHYDEEKEFYLVDNLHKTNFDHIPYYPGDKDKRPIKMTFPHEIRGIKPGNYYLFTWKLSHKNEFNPYEIYIDFKNPPKVVEPKWFIDKLFDDRHNDKSRNFGSAANFLDTLSKQLSANESTFVYELLQNANDYPIEGKQVDVEFHITDNYLLFLHSGDKFNIRNISGICGINEKEKAANKRAIGYKGIGFKTVFLHNHYVYLQTGDYSFRFDEGETPEKKIGGKITRLEAPFQILPIWTEHDEVAQEVNDVFDASDKKFNVRMALRPEDKKILHEGKKNYETLFKSIFADANIILFIPNIQSVKVVIDGKEERMCVRNSDEWIVSDYEESISLELQEAINRTIEKGNSRIPEKHKDFEYTRVSFACNHQGGIIKPIEKATLYCYLPTKASWGLRFLMNSDMIPKGDRNDIETEVDLIGADDLNFNEELAAIAGAKFFSWIKDLLTSRKYNLGSVFSLIPDFDACKKEHDFYAKFIEKFEKAFCESLEERQIVPVSQGLANVNYVIRDTTGLSISGVMSDEEFCRFAGFEEDAYLPLPILRDDKYFKTFLKHYANEELTFTKDDWNVLIANVDFQEWLKDQDNNNKFLKFLLEKGYLAELLQKEIFLEDAGGLFAASDLFYDVDKYIEDLKAFVDEIYFLSPKTREFFHNNKEWHKIVDEAFSEFDCDEFVNDTLLSKDNYNETRERLQDKDTSIHFFKFLAECVSFDDKYLSLPVIDDNDKTLDNFTNRFIFFHSTEGRKICESEWLSSIQIDFITDDYLPVTKEYFKENFEVRDYSDEIIINEVILSDYYKDSVSEAINNNFDISCDFVQFCFSNSNLISDNELSGYSLKAFDCNGDDNWYFAEGDTFFNSSNFDYYSAKEWINPDWMAALDDAYFDNIANKDALKAFFQRAFGVEELTDNTFYSNIVKNNLKGLLGNISGSNDGDGSKNIDFIKYLDDNYQLIFVEKKDADIFRDLNLVSRELHDISLNEENLYIYEKNLKEIIDYAWFPADIVSITHPDYGKSRSLIELGVKTFKFSEFFDDVIAENMNSINQKTSCKEESIAFHHFIIDHYNVLTQEQLNTMKDAKVYLYGNNKPANLSCGHKILSANAKELFNLGLVQISNLDIIDPEYKTNENTEYWEARLDNSKFTVNHFFAWLRENIELFSRTIQDAEVNIRFWRWLKNNVSDKLIEETADLPILLKDGSVDSVGPIYFSDEYMDGAGTEKSVKYYDKSAKFLSPKYIDGEDNIAEWKELFSKVNIKSEPIDILLETIIPQLSSIDDENLPKLIAQNREVLEKEYEDKLISQLTQLRVKAHDGEFRNIRDTVYIDCEKEEPFPYIELPNQITYCSAEERRLIKEIIQEVQGDCVKTLSEWQQRKLDCYLEMQNSNADDVRKFHFKFINELTIIRQTGKESLKELERVEQIKLLDREDYFCDASTLTMGSIYKPFFDFEACEVVLKYISDAYKEKCSEYPGKLFRDLKVHCDFQEEDIAYLKERQCAVYFWGTYLLKKDAAISRIKNLISKHAFDTIACIPTKDEMKLASELYYGAEVSKYVKSVEEWENKVPIESLPDIRTDEDYTLFSLLPFKTSLDFLDALYASITIIGQERRTQLLSWMIESYNETYNAKINKYREDVQALWYNNRNDKVQIKELYALDYKDRTLEQVFGMNPRVVNKAYFPAGESFKRACDILKIQTITSEDLKMEPIDDTVYTDDNKVHKLYALIIAGMTDTNKWKILYDEYTDKLNQLTLHKCQSILITYTEDDSINQSLKKFYREENDFYFVGSLDNKRVFASFVEAYIDFLGIKTMDIDKDLIEDIMDSQKNALEIAKENNTLMLDEDFKSELQKLIPNSLNTALGNRIMDEEEAYQPHRPSFTTCTSQTEDGSDEDFKQHYSLELVDGDNSNEDIHNEEGDDIDGENEDYVERADVIKGESMKPYTTDTTPVHSRPTRNDYTSDDNRHMGNGNKDKNYHSLGETSYNPVTRKKPKPFTKEEMALHRSHGAPLELESLPPTREEIDLLAQCNIKPEQIADTNYLAQLRLYQNLTKEMHEEPEESMEEFVRNASDVTIHKLRDGRYIHTCSAARGVMYASPSVWNKMVDDKWKICVYLDGQGKNFHYINNAEEFLKLVEKDDVIIKITGKEKVDVIKTLYGGLLEGAKGTAYTLIRVAARTNMDAVFAHYVGAMAEAEDGNYDYNDNDY